MHPNKGGQTMKRKILLRIIVLAFFILIMLSGCSRHPTKQACEFGGGKWQTSGFIYETQQSRPICQCTTTEGAGAQKLVRTCPSGYKCKLQVLKGQQLEHGYCIKN